MCGLSGILAPAEQVSIDVAALRRMTDALRHRGPDGDGFHVAPGIGLGHRRLAIIDPAGGQQPMFNEDGSVVIVFNGEIYNFRELRPELEALGHVFRNRCDTEAVIHAWESWGPDCLGRLNGMFAFALWDASRQMLFLARDRLGKKPLCYATLPDGSFAFASEIGALLTMPEISRRLCPRAIDDFFALGYVPDPGSIYQAVRKLPPAHYLLLPRGGGPAVPRRYWDAATGPLAIDAREAVADLSSRLAECTTMRLVADVPLGAFLSGGLDSSAIVALAARARATPLDTFTIGFDGGEDETPYADMVGRRYGTRQHCERSSALDVLAAAREQGRLFGEPFGDPSSVPTARVSALARRHATVALSGDGGDEVFGGYRRYRWHRIVEAMRRSIPEPLRRHAVGRLAAIYPKLDRAPRWLRARHTLTELSLQSALGYYRTVGKVEHLRRRALFAPGLEESLDGYDPSARFVALLEASNTDDPLRQAQYMDLHTWLPGDILTKVDRASMAHSLEVRAPLLDYRLVEWGFALPAKLKITGGEGKHVLKRAIAPLLPRAVLHRPKQGFAVSLATELRGNAARLRGRLLDGPMLDCGLFDPAAIAQLVDEHASGALDHSSALWLLLVFEGFLATELAPTAVGGVVAG